MLGATEAAVLATESSALPLTGHTWGCTQQGQDVNTKLWDTGMLTAENSLWALWGLLWLPSIHIQ